MELVVAEIERGIDGLEWLKVDVDLPFLAFGCDDFSTVNHQAVGRNFGVEL